jgi:hypothetical protein
MKWEGALFLGAALTVTLSTGSLIKSPPKPPPAGSITDDDGGGATGGIGSPPTGGAGTGAGTGSGTPPTAGGPGTGTDRHWRGYVDTDVEALRAQLPPQAKHLAESFIAAGQAHNMDPLFLMSISKLETGSWTSNAFYNKNNAMGISNASGPTMQTSHQSSIMTMAGSLAGAPGTAGYYNNANTVGQVGAIYAPSGAVNDFNGTNSQWGIHVGNNYDNYVNTLR